MVEPEKPLKKKDQIAMDEEVARNLEAQLQAELEEEERISRLKEEKSNIALLESWDNTQAMMDADFQLAQQMQIEEQEQNSKEKDASHQLRHKEKYNCLTIEGTWLDGYKHNQLKSKSYDEIQEMFDKNMKRVNTFVDMNTELVKSSEIRTEGSSKRVEDELEYDNSKRQIILIEKTWRPSGSWLKLNMGIQGQRMNMKECYELQLLSDYYCWKDYADRDEIKD
ncbi:hypothetical protein Tco_0085037 [Tanacetum coccineum]